MLINCIAAELWRIKIDIIISWYDCPQLAENNVKQSRCFKWVLPSPEFDQSV